MAETIGTIKLNTIENAVYMSVKNDDEERTSISLVLILIKYKAYSYPQRNLA